MPSESDLRSKEPARPSPDAQRLAAVRRRNTSRGRRLPSVELGRSSSSTLALAKEDARAVQIEIAAVLKKRPRRHPLAQRVLEPIDARKAVAHDTSARDGLLSHDIKRRRRRAVVVSVEEGEHHALAFEPTAALHDVACDDLDLPTLQILTDGSKIVYAQLFS